MLAVAAAIDRAVAAVQNELGSPPAVLLTGGDAAALRTWLETAVHIEADLVLEGLLAMLEDDA
jgi:pantothenate kinase type III